MKAHQGSPAYSIIHPGVILVLRVESMVSLPLCTTPNTDSNTYRKELGPGGEQAEGQEIWMRIEQSVPNLLQFQSGTTTQLVPPASLSSGKYTQARIGVSGATITIGGTDYPIDIPLDNLKTDRNFEFDVTDGGAVDLTVDFDLSQSIVATGPAERQAQAGSSSQSNAGCGNNSG